MLLLTKVSYHGKKRHLKQKMRFKFEETKPESIFTHLEQRHQFWHLRSTGSIAGPLRYLAFSLKTITVFLRLKGFLINY